MHYEKKEVKGKKETKRKKPTETKEGVGKKDLKNVSGGSSNGFWGGF